MTEEIQFETLGLKITEIVKSYSIEKQKEIFEYLSEMNELERKGYEIAFNHLESSFDIYRSNGFQTWIKSKK
jgi:antitoxin component YwqK of YwqJK toxin-antitoxin module